jgi:hypothetical protein
MAKSQEKTHIISDKVIETLVSRAWLRSDEMKKELILDEVS